MAIIIDSSKIKNLESTKLLLSNSGNDVRIKGDLSIKQTEFIAEELKTNTVINSFSLEYCHIGAVGIIKIAEALKKNPAIAFLNLGGNYIGDDGAIEVAEVIKVNRAIVFLNLGYNGIGEGGTIAIAEALEENETIVSISLESNNIGTVGAMAIAALLRKNTVINSFSLGSCYIEDVGITEIAKALEINPVITNVNLEYNKIGVVGATAIAELIKKNRVIIKLNLGCNDIGDDGITEIAGALEENETIVSVNLEFNEIRDAGGMAIAKVIKVNPVITFLDLSGNPIGVIGIATIAEELKTNAAISFLNLGGIYIGDDGAIAIAEAVKINRVIISLGLVNVYIGDDGIIAIAGALEINTVIITIDLKGNKIGDAGAKAMAKVIKKNRTIISIDLEYNEIGDAGATAMAEALEINNAIINFKLRKNKIEGIGLKAIMEAVKINPVITSADLGYDTIRRAGEADEALERNVEFLCEAIEGFHKNKLMSSGQFITLRTHLKILSVYDDGMKRMFYSSEYKKFYESIIEQLKSHDVNDKKLYHVLIQELSTPISPQLTILEIDYVKPAAFMKLDYDVWGNIIGYLTPGDINSLALVVLPKKPILPDTDSTDYTAIASSAKHMLRFAPTVNYFFKIYGIELPQIPLTSEIRAMLDFKLGMIENHDDGLILGQALESVSYYAIIKNGELLNNNPVTQQPTDLTSLLRICMPELVNGAVTGITLMDPFAIGFGLVSGAAQCLSKHNLLNEESETQAMIRFSLDNAVAALSLVDMCYNGATIGKSLSLINNVVMTDIATKLALSVYEIPLSGHNIEGDFV